jgi:pilus assembly protein TadC
MLSDDAKLEELRERITDVARSERNGLLIIPTGVFLLFVGLIFSVIGSNDIAHFGGIFVSALGIFSTLLGFYVTVHYARQYDDLLNELERTL